mgnify:CR=1 FL=1
MLQCVGQHASSVKPGSRAAVKLGNLVRVNNLQAAAQQV